MLLFKFCLLIFGLTIVKANIKSDDPLVVTKLGTVQGYTKSTINGRQIFAFEGVPYAKPPIGKRRFERPQTIKSWPHKIVANTIYKCLQYRHEVLNPDVITGEEDCLYLNIYTPSLETKRAGLPVIVYIHGGAFMFNYGGAYGPEFLLEKDLVFVNVNYRLGPFGFLSTEDDQIAGNMGLWDQILALKWVKKHIKNFGGDPNLVTIAGNSAGGASVQLHYLIPESRNLFLRGISQSGTALNAWVLMEKPLEKTQKLAQLVGCPDTSKEMVECLKTISSRQLVKTVPEFQPFLYTPFSPFGVVVDAWSSNPLLPTHPYVLLKNKQAYNAPWIISHVNGEGLYPGADFYFDHHLDNLNKNWNGLAPHILDYNFTTLPKNLNKISQKIRSYYFGNKTIDKSSYNQLIKMIGDRLFGSDIDKALRLQIKANSEPVYLYYFTYRGNNSLSDYRTKTKINFGASHADDLTFIVKTFVDTTSTLEDRKMSEFLVEQWYQFAKNGKPSLPEWLPVSRQSKVINFLKIANPDSIRMDEQMELGEQTFWSSLALQENGHLVTEPLKDEL